MDAKTDGATSGEKPNERETNETAGTVGGARRLGVINIYGQNGGKNRRKPSVSFRLYALRRRFQAGRGGGGALFSEKSTRASDRFEPNKTGGEKVEKNFGSALYKGEVCVIMTNRVAEVAELADALGSGPSPRNWGWRFESSLRHSFKSSFSRRTLFLFLGGDSKKRKFFCGGRRQLGELSEAKNF